MKNTTKLLNSYIASLLVWNVKLHNIHWNVTGHLFKPVHEYTEALYDRAFDAYDDVAEILKMRDESPVATLKDSLAQSVIKEGTFKTVCCSEAVAMIEADMKTMQKLAAEIRDAAPTLMPLPATPSPLPSAPAAKRSNQRVSPP